VLSIRPERKDDYAQITQIKEAAFGQTNEGRLVENICQSSHCPQIRLTLTFVSRALLVAAMPGMDA